MFSRPIQIPSKKFERMEAVIEEVCRESGLILKLKSSLAKYPGSVHWHFKKGTERGTLEITFWKKEKRAWFSVQSKRTGSWIPKTIRTLRKKIETG
jgi:hypothetical protein